MSRLLEESDVAPPQADELPTYIVEVAKSGRAECKKCDCKIENKCIRIGVIVDGEWGLFTRWQHLDCTVFHKGINSVEELDGFSDLNTQQKDLVKERFALSTNEIDEDMEPIDPDELVRKAWEKPVEPSPNLLMPLLPYQKEGLGWMVNQEQNDVHGGILADEMGMGKTIQAIALMLQNRPDMSDFAQLREWAASDARHAAPAILDSSTSSTSSSSEGPEPMVRCGTLIVLPTVAIRQWQTEIARFTKEGSLTVKVYHGSDRNTSALDLTKTDIVLTSYKILEIEYRKATAGTKVTCRVCQKKFYPDKLRVHRKYFCGESAQRTAAQALTQKKKARTGAKAGTTTPTRPDASATKAKNNRKRPRNAFGVADSADADCEQDEEEMGEEEPSGSASKRPRGGKNGAKARGTATVGKGKGSGNGNGKGRGKGKEVSNDSDSSPHSSGGEDENEEDENGEEGGVPPVKVKKAVQKLAGAPAAGKGKNTVEIKTEPVDTSKRGASQVKIKIKTEPGTEDMDTSTVPISAAKTKKQVTSKQQKASATPDSASKAPTKGKRGGAAQKDTAAVSAYWPDIDAPDTPTTSSSDAEDRHQGDHVVSSGSDLDAPTMSRHTPRGQKSPAPAAVNARARGRKTPPTSGTKAVPMSGVKAEPGTISVTVTPLRAPTRRAAAQGQKKYTDGTRDSDFDVASSDEDVVANKKTGNNKQVKLMLAAEEAELDVDSEFEIEAEEEEKAGASSSSSEGENDSGSDVPTESEEEGEQVVKGRARGGAGNSRGKVTPAKKSVAPARSPANGKGRASPASSAKGTSNAKERSRASAARNSKKVSVAAKGKAAVGKKRPAAGHAQSDDDDDVAWESGSDNTAESSDDSNSNTGSDGEGESKGRGRGGKNNNKAGSDDSEVERDIQQALLEAAAAQRRSKQGAAVSVLHLVSWFRIILDEAHLIKDRSTSTAKAVFNLTSLNKWCLTGTPLQNRVGELYSLIRFLRVDPHAFYYCRTKGCCCKSLHYRFTKSYCDDCHHSVIQHYCHFNKHILNPIKRSGYVADGRRAMLKLKQQVLDEILLRRTKTTRAEDIQLPPRVVTVRSEKLDVKEEDFYSALYTQSQAQFNTYLQSGTVLNNYAHIFDILIRLRQAVDHPYLVIYSEAQVAKKDDSENYLNLSSGNNH
eukprot:gene19528-22199_t